jgi:hypothetical protein
MSKQVVIVGAGVVGCLIAKSSKKARYSISKY